MSIREGLADIINFACEDQRQAQADARIEKLEEALRFYATPHAIPNDGPWGVNSKDYGYIASIALGETT
jgi:hypothetical protein